MTTRTRPASTPEPSTFAALEELLRGRRMAVLTGAGCSTESGIPDYRGPKTRHRDRSPLQYREFVRDPAARARYWARSAVGWSRMAEARPNPGHRALARMEAGGQVKGLITQNVDGLHRSAGSERVVELHGRLARVRCLECGGEEARAELQRRILELNPGWDRRSAEIAPDGDAELSDAAAAAFRVPGCRACGGVIKPDVVFFGENVPAGRTERAWRLLDGADALLVAGSSLRVWSGYRFVVGAVRQETPVAIVNLGRTRGDDLARLRVHAPTGRVLPRLADRLLAAPSRASASRPYRRPDRRSHRHRFPKPEVSMSLPSDRLVTFDCYGTLIDWKSGVLRAFRLHAPESSAVEDARLFDAFHEAQLEAESGEFRPYREVLEVTELRVAERFGWDIPPKQAGFLAESLPSWRPFPEVTGALERLRRGGYGLAILSNIDDDLLAASLTQIGIGFDLLVTAERVRSYKPRPAHFEQALEAVEGDRSRLVHVAQSWHFDVEPARSLGLPVVWVNREAERPPADASGPTPGGAVAPGETSPGADAIRPSEEVGDLDEAVGWIEARGT